MVSVHLIEKVTFKQRLGGEEVGCAGICWKCVLGRGNSLCKGPGAGACLRCLSTREESDWSRMSDGEKKDGQG